MPKRHGKDIVQEAGVSKNDERIVRDITRKLAESAGKTLHEQEILINQAAQNKKDKTKNEYQDLVNKAFFRIAKEKLDKCVEKTNGIQGTSQESEENRRAIYANYEKDVKDITDFKDKLIRESEN